MRFRAARLFAGLLFFFGALGQVFIIGFFFLGVALGGTPFNLGLGFGYGLEALCPPGKFFRDVHPIRQISLVGSFRLAKEFSDFRLELLFELAGMIVTQGFMLGGIRLDLCPVQTDGAQFQDARLLGDQQDLDKQTL